MENLILIINNRMYTIGVLTLFLIAIIFILKKSSFKTSKIFKYLYFIYWFLVFTIIFQNSPYLSGEKIKGVYYIILSFLTIKLIDLILKQVLMAKIRKKEVPQLIINTLTLIFFVISILFILRQYYHINLTSLLTTSAILSAVIGLALQDTLTTFISGLILTTDNSLEIGDTIEIDDICGKVIDTNWHSTKLQKLGGGLVSIPNNLLLKSIKTNYYKKSNLILRIKVGCSYGDPPNKVKDILLDIADKNKKVLKNPEPYVVLLEFNDFSIDYELRLWVFDEYLRRARIETEIKTAIWYAFKREGIKIPFPIREILRPKDMVEDTKIDHLYFKNIDFFSDLNEKDIDSLIKISKRKLYGKDEFIFYQDEEGDSFFLIKEGRVAVIIDSREITTLNSGDFFGEMSLLSGKPRTASIQVMEDTEVLIIYKEYFKDLIKNNKNVFDNVLKYLSEREAENIKNKKKYNTSSEFNDKQLKSIKKNVFKRLVNFFEI